MDTRSRDSVPRDRRRLGHLRHSVVFLAFVGNLILWGDRANIGVAAPEIARLFH